MFLLSELLYIQTNDFHRFQWMKQLHRFVSTFQRCYLVEMNSFHSHVKLYVTVVISIRKVIRGMIIWQNHNHSDKIIITLTFLIIVIVIWFIADLKHHIQGHMMNLIKATATITINEVVLSLVQIKSQSQIWMRKKGKKDK